jgi:twitching motility two-component system response regulator PilG
VAVFGLANKFQRLMEIVLRHARHNQYRYVVARSPGPGDYDIALVDMTSTGGPEVASTLRRLPHARPVVRMGRRNDVVRGRDDLLQASFTANLLKTLNRVVEEALLGRGGLGLEFGARRFGPAVEPVARARVLIVDDSPTVRRQLAVALQQMGLDSEGVGSAREALDTLTTRRYDLVFVDVVMPEMDGYKLTREIKRHRLLRPVPVIILTSRSSPFDLARGALSGCNSYLVKPVSLRSLRETVARHLKASAARGGAGRLSTA